MNKAFKTRLAALLPAMLLAPAAYIMLADYLNYRQARQFDAPTSPTALTLPQPWGGYGWRQLARTAGNGWLADPDTALQAIQAAAPRYPIDSGQWLDHARILTRAGRLDPVAGLLGKAHASQPFEREALWAASQIALETGQPELAERQLRQWLDQYPRDTEQALFIARRWIDQPGERIDRVLPAGPVYLAQAMAVARVQRDRELAEAAWQRFEPRPGLDDAAFLDYVQLLLETGDIASAFTLWSSRDRHVQSGVANGSFSRELGSDIALNWRSRAPAGVRIERDLDVAASEPASLKIEFNGKENIHLAAPWILMPARAGGHYRLSGAWRAERLTTRALPYLLLTAEGGLSEKLALPQPNFDWQAFSIDFQVPEQAPVQVSEQAPEQVSGQATLLRLQLRRDRTEAFDRNIDGRLWLDSLSLQPIEAPIEALPAFVAAPG
ncbi:MAG: hypothetical protein RQ741_11760 [Wenzhouxiangellaceae bacterium]|nr:hypothetical protein [Wenzhouxiangellaceae bacterium]